MLGEIDFRKFKLRSISTPHQFKIYQNQNHRWFKTTQNHYVYIDTLHLEAAGGKIEMSGYFNGSNKS